MRDGVSLGGSLLVGYGRGANIVCRSVGFGVERETGFAPRLARDRGNAFHIDHDAVLDPGCDAGGASGGRGGGEVQVAHLHHRLIALLVHVASVGRQGVHPPLEFQDDGFEILVAGVRNGAHPRLHVFVAVGYEEVGATPGAIEHDLKGVSNFIGKLYATVLEDDHAHRLLVLFLLKVEEKVPFQDEPPPLNDPVRFAALLKVAFLVNGRGTQSKVGNILFVQLHYGPVKIFLFGKGEGGLPFNIFPVTMLAREK